jgi:hypothetical protein
LRRRPRQRAGEDPEVRVLMLQSTAAN